MQVEGKPRLLWAGVEGKASPSLFRRQVWQVCGPMLLPYINHLRFQSRGVPGVWGITIIAGRGCSGAITLRLSKTMGDQDSFFLLWITEEFCLWSKGSLHFQLGLLMEYLTLLLIHSFLLWKRLRNMSQPANLSYIMKIIWHLPLHPSPLWTHMPCRSTSWGNHPSSQHVGTFSQGEMRETRYLNLSHWWKACLLQRCGIHKDCQDAVFASQADLQSHVTALVVCHFLLCQLLHEKQAA